VEPLPGDGMVVHDEHADPVVVGHGIVVGRRASLG
jgi:hypothetical protein